MTPFLQVDHLTKSFGDLVLFKDISFGIAQGEKVGLIAPNGSGKTTLLQIIAGKEGHDNGSIVFRNDGQVTWLEQSPRYPDELTVLEACFHSPNRTVQLIAEYEAALASNADAERMETLITRMEQEKAWDYERKAKQILTELKIRHFDQPIGTLSGGQLKRVALANVLITEPDLLLLDEPTNHLDLEMVEWLENHLNRSSLSLLMVTHDRYFLDRICSRIIEIDQKSLFSYKGNYAYYVEKKTEHTAAGHAELARANNLYKKELEWIRRQPQARAGKAKYRIDAFHELEEKIKQKREAGNVKLNVKSAYIGSKIFDAVNVCKRFDDVRILENFNYTFARYEKLGIIGQNGTGKSTFIKMLIGEVAPDSGHFDIGETVRFGYYSQDGLSFDENAKVIDIVHDIAEHLTLGDEKTLTASQFLGHFLFPPEKQHNYVYKLSGGEKRRLYLCTILMRNPNFLVLDEPTNDFDIATLNVLEEYLRSFKGCVIVVSHDRYFMDKVVDHVLIFHGNAEIQDFPGNYTQYREWKEEKLRREREEAEASPKQGAGTETSAQRQRTNDKRRLSYKERMELETLEKEIEALEAEKQTLENALCSGTLSVEELTEKSKRLPLLNNELDEKSMRWLELSEIEG